MPLQLHHRVVVIRLQRQVAALSIALEESSFLQESGYTVTDGQNRDRQRIYTSKSSLAEAVELSPGFDWPAFLSAADFGTPETFVIAQTDYFATLGEIVRTTPVAIWRTYAKFMTLRPMPGI